MRTHAFAFALLGSLSTLVSAANYSIRRNEVLPVVLEDQISMRGSREGDRFTAQVARNSGLPGGTRLEGVVRRVRQSHGDRPGYVVLEFNRISLPDGEQASIQAIPVPAKSDLMLRDREGKFYAKRYDKERQDYAAAGGIGGLIIGSTIRKPIEGAILGAVGGLLAAESDPNKDGDLILKRGTRLGALVQRGVTISDGRYDRDERPILREDDRDRDREEPTIRNVPREEPLPRREPQIDLPSRNETIRVEYGQTTLDFRGEESPYRADRTVMVPMEKMAERLEVDYDRQDSGDLQLDTKDHVLKLAENSRSYELDGKPGTLPQPIVKRGKVWFIPVEAFSLLRPDQVRVDGRAVSMRDGY